MEQDDRMFVKVPNFETESSQNENFRLKPGGAGPFPSVPKSQGWIVGTNEEDLYCEACSCDGGSVDMYTDPRQKRDKPVGRTDEDRESQQSASVIFGNSACPDSQLRIDSTSRPIEDTFQPDCPGTATPARQHQTSHKEDLVKKRRRKKKQKDTQPPPDPLIRKSIELACSRIRRDATAHVLDQLRQIYIEGILGNSQFFDLLDSGLVLSNRKREYFMDRMIVTMRDGARLALSRAEHGYISYYRPCVEFHCVQQLGDNWFRVRDKTTGQLVLMKKGNGALLDLTQGNGALGLAQGNGALLDLAQGNGALDLAQGNGALDLAQGNGALLDLAQGNGALDLAQGNGALDLAQGNWALLDLAQGKEAGPSGPADI
ncbi:hypothetical protein scyTo_0020795 [Scyliorhinus torazame]|uniref:Uncharacterized protein n=1 Tax=Scyliorhinus torazame TaxID=75743 RepID=A0A401PNX5_SCYTO|nr:hypothetical protein [Scyliorhinus torazame]